MLRTIQRMNYFLRTAFGDSTPSSAALILLLPSKALAKGTKVLQLSG
jgi:hypothetical protein